MYFFHITSVGFFFFESLCYFAYPSVLVCAFLHLLCRCARMNFTEETCVPGFPYVFEKGRRSFAGGISGVHVWKYFDSFAVR